MALVSDFDGTISRTDFFYYVINNLLIKEDVAPWLDYEAGKITHIEALRQIFCKIRLPEKEFVDFVLSLPLEEAFVDTVKYCSANNIGFYIVSAGADYYINLILEHLNIKDLVKLISNPSVYSQEKGLQILESDLNSIYYSSDYGINKKLALESIRKKYDFIVFAGDGGPDIDAAKLAEKVFARGLLLDLCQENNIKTVKLESYSFILDYLKAL